MRISGADLVIKELESRGLRWRLELGGKHHFIVGEGFRLPVSKASHDGAHRKQYNLRADLRRQLRRQAWPE